MPITRHDIPPELLEIFQKGECDFADVYALACKHGADFAGVGNEVCYWAHCSRHHAKGQEIHSQVTDAAARLVMRLAGKEPVSA